MPRWCRSQQVRPGKAAGLKVKTGLRVGGLAPDHRRLIAEADRLLAAADVQIARRERVIERVRRELAA